MYGAAWLVCATVFRGGRASADVAEGLAGRPTLAPTTFSCTGVLSTYFRKLAQAGSAAPVGHEKPAPPPRTRAGAPAPPVTAGNGNQPSCEVKLVLVVRPCITPGSQSPCSSMAAWPVETMPAELPAPAWDAVPRKPVWNGLVAMKVLRSWPAFTKHAALTLTALIAAFSVAVEHSRTAR